MAPIVIILIFLSFCQASLWPINLVLVVLLCRSFIVSDRANFFLAFALGLFLAFLQGYLLGILSVTFLAMVAIVYLVKRTPFAENLLVIFITTLFLLIIDYLLIGNALGINFNYWPAAAGALLGLPIFIILRFWEERFIPKSNIKLKY